MITNVITAIQFMLVIFSLLLIFYKLHRGDNKEKHVFGFTAGYMSFMAVSNLRGSNGV